MRSMSATKFLQAKVAPGTEVLYVQGCNVTGDGLNQIREAQEGVRVAEAKRKFKSVAVKARRAVERMVEVGP